MVALIGGELSNTEYPEAPRVAVGAIVFKDDRVLMVRRGQPPGEDQWAIPGGSVRLGETLQAAAEREIMEETGITIRAGKAVYTFDAIVHDREGKVRFHYVINDLDAEYVSGEIQAGDDAREARWLTVDELNQLPLNPVTREVLRDLYQFI